MLYVYKCFENQKRENDNNNILINLVKLFVNIINNKHW